MDLRKSLPNANQYGDSIDLLPILLHIEKDKESIQMAPSSFMAEMILSTEERLEKLRKSKQKPLALSQEHTKTFEVTPEIIIFQNFKPGTIYTTPMSLRNAQHVSRPLRGIFPSSPYFSVSCASESVPSHIAPGMSLTFGVKFCAEDVKDYKYDLVFLTEEESFCVPVVAIGPRPLLDLPDNIKLPKTAINVSSERATMVRNLGQVQAVFTINTKPPFSVKPTKGILEPSQDMQLTIYFKSPLLGTFHDYMVVSYQSGEKLSIKLKGRAENSNIALEKGALQFQKTYVGLTRQRCIKLFNNSKHIVQFQWKLYESASTERENAEKIKKSLMFMKEHETIKDNKLRTLNLVDSEGHSQIYNRIYEDEIDEFESQDQFLYQNKYFEVIPVKGEVWPGGTFDFTIIFSPTSVRTYHSNAYLEVTGRSERIRLILNGLGIGPHIQLNVEYLNANKIYMCAVHQYEVVAVNQGDIPGEVYFKHREPEFGGTIDCWPTSMQLDPSECGAFVFQFSSKVQGKFMEEIRFAIKDSDTILRIIFVGEIICPLLNFELTEVDFGRISVGDPVRSQVVLRNPSMVPIAFELYMHNDGEIPALTFTEFASISIKCGPYKNAKEFDFFPRTGIVAPNSSLSVELTVIANAIRDCSTILTVNMWGTDQCTKSIPVKYTACTPNIVCIPTEMNIRFCFVTYPYNRTISLYNDSPISGFFQVIPQQASQKGGITCTCALTEGYLKPYEEVELNLTIVTKILGEDKFAFFIKLFGDEPIQVCAITLHGQGPVVTIQPDKMDFGQVQLLETTNRELTVMNDSPVPAFIATRISPKTLFVIEPRVFELQPDESLVMTISIYLSNRVTIKDELQLEVEHGTNAKCSLKAKGVGTSIFFEPKIHPVLNIGTFFTHQTFILDVKCTNKGYQAHKILWSRNSNLKQLKENPANVLPSIFAIVPTAFDLAYNESIDIQINGLTPTPLDVEEDFYCYAMIGKTNQPTIIVHLKIVAKFVDPQVKLSKNELHFRQDVAVDHTVEFLIDEVSVTNKSNLPLQMDIHLPHPFYIICSTTKQRKKALCLELNHEQTQSFLVEFDPLSEDKRCFAFHEQMTLNYINHSKVEKINLIGEVNYPNVMISPNVVDFFCLPINAVGFHAVIVKNISPLPVTYHFEWQEEAIMIEELDSQNILLPVHEVDFSLSRSSSDSGTYLKELQLMKEKQMLAAIEEAKEKESKPVNGQKQSEGKKSKKSEEKKSKQSEGKKSKKAEKGVEEKPVTIEKLDLTVVHESDHHLPVEYLFQRSHLEKDPSFTYIQIEDMVQPSVYMQDVLHLTQRNKEYLLEMRAILYAISAGFDEPEDNVHVVKELPRNRILRNNIDLVLDIAPIHGVLKPYECQLVSIGFHPLSQMSVIAQAQCYVAGGAVEFVDMIGRSSGISYSIDKAFIDFGRHLFCESREKTITLTNTGHIEFEFLSLAKEFPNPIPSDFLLDIGCLTVTPKRGILQPGNSIPLCIQFFPGIAGEFNESVVIQIGYAPAATITVHGYGVFPQTYLNLPRPTFETLPRGITYLAIATLTPDYLRSLKFVKNMMHYSLTNFYDEDIPKVVREKLKKDNWVIISHNDIYPSIMDIELAIERTILFQEILDNPTILLKHTRAHKAVVIPNFITPQYLLDFGHVVLDTVANFTVLIFNYGPVDINVKLLPIGGKKSAFVQSGLTIEFSRSVIRVGDTKELFVIFHPPMEAYPELDCSISFPFYLDVGHGPRINVGIRAIVTVPRVQPEVTCLEFGEVRCGDCLKKSLIIRNKGHVGCQWRAIIEKQEGRRRRRYSIENVRKKPVFFLRNSSGVLAPGSGYSLDLYFEPQFNGNVEWSIVFVVNQNPDEVVVTLRGNGLKPSLKIVKDKIAFDPVLPYVQKCEEYFTVENSSTFPIEFYFTDYDIEIDEEERIVNLLTQFYDLNDLYLPLRVAGQKLPQPLSEFYNRVFESLRKKLQRIEKERIEEEHKILWLNSSEEIASTAKSSRTQNVSAGNITLVGSILPRVASVGHTDPITRKTPEELDILLKEHLQEMIIEEHLMDDGCLLNEPKNPDPVHSAILEAKGAPIPKDPTNIREGVFIIFHGAPTTNLIQAANRAGLEIGVPVYSIDRLYIESLAANDSSATVKVNEIINKAFKEVASEIDLTVEEGTDAYDEVKKKVDLLLSGKEKKAKPKSDKSKKDEKGKKGGSSKTTSQKSSSKGSKAPTKKKDNRPTFMGIPEDLLFEILKQRLSVFTTGIIIESLYGTFLRQPIVAVNNLLKAIGNVHYLHCIILSYTYEENLVFETALKEIEGKRESEQREALILQILEMDADEFDALSPEAFALFKKVVLEARKLNTKLKREALRKRLMDIKLGIKPVKGKKEIKITDKKAAGADSKKGGAAEKGTKKSPDDKSNTKTSKSKTSKDSKSSKSKKGSKESKEQLSPEEAEKKDGFNSFTSDLQILMHILEYWDRKTCTLLKPLPVGGKGKSSSGKKASSKQSSAKKLPTPSKTSSLRIPVENIPLTLEEETKLKQTGIPCWLLPNAHRDKPVASIIAYYLQHTPDLQEAIEDLKDSLMEKIAEVIEMYTVSHRTKEVRVKNPSNIFIVQNAELLSEAALISGFGASKDRFNTSIIDVLKQKSLESRGSIGSKTQKRRRSSETHKIKHSSVSIHSSRRSTTSSDQAFEQETDEIFISRAVLNPGEKLRYRVIFKPETSGAYEHTFTIETTGWPKKYYLTCNGMCDIPQLDMRPENIFAKTVKKRAHRNMYANCLFVTDQNVFDFGPALLEKKEDLGLFAIETEFNFTNCSLLACEASFSFTLDTKIYEFDPEVLRVDPETTKVLTMRATPTILENTDNQLVISIKNNPAVKTIHLTSEGCKVEFNVSPKTIHFNRTLINRVETQSIFLENESLIAINWEFTNAYSMLEHFKISQLSGFISAKTTQDVTVEFSPVIVQDVPTRKLEIEVYDKEFNSKGPLHTEFIEISAEAIAVTLECLKEMRLGEIKGRFEHVILYTMMNKGKYNVEFAFTDVNKDQDDLYEDHAAVRSYFKMVPPTGNLLPNKLYTAKFVFFAKKLVDIRNVPILNCTFTEPATKTVIETFPLMVYVKTFFAGFELCPPTQINFGHQLVATEKIQEMTLTNHGKFDFNYTVLSLRKMLDDKKKKASGKGGKSKSKSSKISKKDEKKTEKSSKSKKSDKSSKSKKSDKSSKSNKSVKRKPTKLDAGIFSVISSTGTIEPNGTCTIQVFSKPKQIGVFEETIVFFISECIPSLKKGVYVSLNVTGCSPSINLSDFNGIFREHYIVNKLSEFECPNEIGAHCVFIKEEVRLHFGRAMLNKEAIGRIRLENIGPIAADVIAKITSPEDVFSVKPEEFNIETYTSSYTTIYFKPNGINTFCGTLDLCPVGGMNKLQINLSGEGLVPEVVLKTPKYNEALSCYEINFTPTFVGDFAYHTISFDNVGVVPCQVIIEICDGTLDVFTLMPEPETRPFLKVCEDVIQATAHTNIVKLEPEQNGVFKIYFKPVASGYFNCMAKLHIVDNPFETFMISIMAEAYIEHVTLSGLPTMSGNKFNSFEDLCGTNPGYELDFGYSFLNSLQKKCFQIINHSPDDNYKFKFTTCDKLVFIPAVGHLKPKATKDIIATFLTKRPVNIIKEVLECTICMIQYVNPHQDYLSWDERQNFVIWEPMASTLLKSPRTSLMPNQTLHSKNDTSSNLDISNIEILSPSQEAAIKTIKEKAEPEIEILADSTRCFPIYLSAVCDYSSYECTENKIAMADTLAFEKQSYSFEISNTSNVHLTLNWKISMDESYPKRINSGVMCDDTTQYNRGSYNSLKFIQSARHMLATTTQNCAIGNRRPKHLVGNEHFLPSELPPHPPSKSKSSLFSSDANYSDRSNDSWMDFDLLPFSITPMSVVIDPKGSASFKITFSPKDVFCYKVHLQSEISNLHPHLKHLDILVRARSILPLYHFDIPESNYLIEGRKGRKFCQDIADENTKVVEFEAIGLDVAVTSTFHILNPTGETFGYNWVPAETNCKDVSLFHCHTPEGFVEKGKMADAIFSFLPQHLGVFEMFYLFRIEKYQLSRTFLLAGIAREPNVYFTNPHLQMRRTIVGIDVTECISLKNKEKFEIDFKFKKESLYSEARLQALSVEPLKGILRPGNEEKIQVTFRAVIEGEVNFNLKCVVEKIKKPLNLSVTANCFQVQPCVFYDGLDEKINLCSETVNVLDLKTMIPLITQNITFTIQNNGLTGFYYSWTIKEDFPTNKVKITFHSAEGYIKSQNECPSILNITALKQVDFDDLKISLEIRYGPSFVIHLTGSTAISFYTFSVDEYDFGPCLIQTENSTAYYTKIIEFKNNKERNIMLECKMLLLDHLSINFKSKQIEPKKSEFISITFTPHEIKQYYAEIEFFVNSLPHILKIKGEGVCQNIQLSSPEDKFIDLGCVHIGQTSTRLIKVANHSRTAADIIFDLCDRLPYFSRPKVVLKPEFEIEVTPLVKPAKGKDKMDKKGKGKDSKGSSKKSKSDKSSKKDKDKNKSSKKSLKSSKGSKTGGKKEKKEKKEKRPPIVVIPPETPEERERRLIRKFVTFSPTKFTLVSAQHSTEFLIKYSPMERMKMFTEKVSYQVQDRIETLCVFKGCCIGPDYVLDKSLLAFGSVTQGCFNKQKVALQNTGDLGGAFKWSFFKPQINFVITPKEGYISPGSSVTFLIKFKPTHITCFLETQAKCCIEKFNKPLELTLTGSCFNRPSPKETLKFVCPVRETATKNITIQNPSGQIWKISPTVEGQYFICPESFKIDPKSSSVCEVIYQPLTMTDKKQHEATIFFCFPQGQGLLYNLLGTANVPKPFAVITREITSKVYHTESLTVQNWLKTPQRFSVFTEAMLPVNPNNKILYKLTGNEAIDVLEKSQRDYTWTIYVLNQGSLKFKVIFKNLETKEYVFYEIVLTVTTSPPLGVVTLTTCLRIPVFHTLKLQNPIKTPVIYSIRSTFPELSCDSTVTVQPLSEYSLVIKYNPLLLGQTEATLDVVAKELGSYIYNFVLTAHSPIPEPPVCFTANLGQAISEKAIIVNNAIANADFICLMEHPNVFYLDKALSVPPQKKTEFEIFFSPDSIGTVRSSLTLSSSATGSYIYPLIGTCNLPKPQGPYFVKPGGTSAIIFINPFADTKSFNFAVEPAIFNLKFAFENVKGRKEIKIVISLVPLKQLEILIDQKYPITGKLVVYCDEPEICHIKWIYYLQGDIV